MQARELFKQGRLDECLQALTVAVREDPSAPAPRLFLLQLMAVMGDWQRAANQARLLGEIDPARGNVYALLAGAAAGEIERAAALAGKAEPHLPIGEMPEWARAMHEGWRRRAAGDTAGAVAQWTKGISTAPEIIAGINGAPPDAVYDLDDRFGPILECVIEGRYCWLTLDTVESIVAAPPTQLHDTIWQPVAILTSDGRRIDGMAPTRYPGSEQSSDAALRLGHRTEFTEEFPGVACGVGQRLLACGDLDVPQLELRRLSKPVAEISPAATAPSLAARE